MRARLIRLAVFVGLVLTFAPAAAAPASADTTPEEMSETFRIGPFDLAPEGAVGDQVNRLFEDAPRPDGDLAIRSIEWDFVDGEGNPIPDHVAHLHHIVLLDSARPDHLCSYPGQSRFAGTGKELTDMVLPEGYAYHAPDAPWSSVYHVMNLSDVPITASIEYTITWTDPAEGGFKDVEPYFFDVTGCWGNSEYDVPGDGGPGSIHEQSRTYTIDREGTAVVAGGHIHAGGTDIVMYRNDDELCRAEAVYHEGGHGGHHSLKTVTPCGVLEEPLLVGDEIRLVSRYRNDAPVPGAMGIMVTYVHHTGPPPPPPTLEIRSVGLADGVLSGEIVCNRSLQVNLDGSVTQDKGGPPIELYGYSQPVVCQPDPVPFTVELMYGNGALTGGPVEYQLSGWASDGRDHVTDEVSGRTRSKGRIEPSGPNVEPGGPLPISVDRAAPEPGTVTGTVTCDTPTSLYLDVQGTQKVGRHLIDAYGWTELSCDGATSFAVPVESYNGRLSGGPLDVVVYAYGVASPMMSVGTATVVLPGSPPPAGSEPALPPPDPASPLQIVDAVSAPGGVEVVLSHSGCPQDVSFQVDVLARHARHGRGKRVTDALGGWYGFAEGTCDGSAMSVTVLVPTDEKAKKLHLHASLSWFDPRTGAFGSDSNTAEVKVARR